MNISIVFCEKLLKNAKVYTTPGIAFGFTGENNLKQKECKWYQCCPMKCFLKQGRLEKKWVENYCHGDWEKCIRFQKEENGVYHPDNMLPNGEIDENLS